MFCTQCGTRMDDQARFCTACGKPVAHPPVDDPFSAREPRFDQGRPFAETAAPPAQPASEVPPAAPAGDAWAGSRQWSGSQDWSGSQSTGAQAAAAPRRLKRIPSKKKIAGVCAGFAEYFDMDVTLMRLIWVALLFIPPHVGLIAYIIAWAVLPKG